MYIYWSATNNFSLSLCFSSTTSHFTVLYSHVLYSHKATGPLVVSGEDTLNAGEISRDLVADVCVASLSDAKASNKVLEIIEDDGKPPEVFNGLKM